MGSIIDPGTEEVGNPNRVIEELTAASAASASGNDNPAAKPKVDLPERFKGKSAEEIYQAYQNLEREHGRLANEVGTTRLLADQLLELKRSNDLRANGGNPTPMVNKPAVRAADLLENPTEVLDRYFEGKESAQAKDLRERLERQEAVMLQKEFVSKHGDWQDQVADPAFTEWAKATPLRAKLAAEAAQGNLRSADSLLDEFKTYKPLISKTKQTDPLDQARKVGLERASGANDAASAPAGKVFKRADLMALRVNDPDRYENPAFQAEILKAYAEGRVR
jgi:hypothetical protein